MYRRFRLAAGKPDEEDAMLYMRETKGTIDEVVKRVEAATIACGFGVLYVHDLKEKMAAKGVSFDRECRILEVCNPQQAKAVLKRNMAISTALPCRISVYEDHGCIKVATLKPTEMLKGFGDIGLEDVAEDVERKLIDIIQQACRS